MTGSIPCSIFAGHDVFLMPAQKWVGFFFKKNFVVCKIVVYLHHGNKTEISHHNKLR